MRASPDREAAELQDRGRLVRLQPGPDVAKETSIRRKATLAVKGGGMSGNRSEGKVYPQGLSATIAPS